MKGKIIMDFKKLIEEKNWKDYSVGLGGCRTSNYFLTPCDYDVTIFDNKSLDSEIIQFQNNFVNIHHGSFSESNSKKLIRYDNMQIIQDDSWDLRMLLSKVKEKRLLYFKDYAKNSLFEAIFCCEITKQGIKENDVFAPCWQKCASYFLADGITALNHHKPSSTHMLDVLRRFEKNPINEKISVVNQTVGIERSIPSLLERMLKSTIGFSEKFEKNDHHLIIQQKHDYFIQNSMLADCYFYLGYVNKEIFSKFKNSILKQPDLIHILKISFDIDMDANLLEGQANLVEKSSNEILEYLSKR